MQAVPGSKAKAQWRQRKGLKLIPTAEEFRLNAFIASRTYRTKYTFRGDEVSPRIITCLQTARRVTKRLTLNI